MLSKKSFSLSALAGALACALISPSAYGQTLECLNQGKDAFEVLLPDTLFAKKATVLTHWGDPQLYGRVYWIEQSEWDYKVTSGEYILETFILFDQEPHCQQHAPFWKGLKCIHNGMKNTTMRELVINRFNGTAKLTDVSTRNYKSQTPKVLSLKCSVAEKQRQRMF